MRCRLLLILYCEGFYVLMLEISTSDPSDYNVYLLKSLSLMLLGCPGNFLDSVNFCFLSIVIVLILLNTQFQILYLQGFVHFLTESVIIVLPVE